MVDDKREWRTTGTLWATAMFCMPQLSYQQSGRLASTIFGTKSMVSGEARLLAWLGLFGVVLKAAAVAAPAGGAVFSTTADWTRRRKRVPELDGEGGSCGGVTKSGRVCFFADCLFLLRRSMRKLCFAPSAYINSCMDSMELVHWCQSTSNAILVQGCK